jgi:hypothetical protein
MNFGLRERLVQTQFDMHFDPEAFDAELPSENPLYLIKIKLHDFSGLKSIYTGLLSNGNLFFGLMRPG